MKPALLVLAVPCWAVAQDLLPQPVPGTGAEEVRLGGTSGVRGWAADDSPVLLDRLDSIEVTGSETGAATTMSGGVTLRGMTVDEPAGLATELSEWLGRPLTETGLDRLTEVILRHYEEHGRPVNEIWLPPQDGADGGLRVNVAEGRIGQIGLAETRHFNGGSLRRGLRSREGDPLTTAALQADLDWLSRNPFRRASLFAAPSPAVGADLLFQIDERRPWRIYAGYENTGAGSVGENRWLAGFNLGDAFGRDQLLDYQFTVGDSAEDFTAHSLVWEIPIHSYHHYIRVSAALADVTAREPGITAEGTSWQISALYGIALPRLGGLRQEIRFGPEIKHADNFALFGDLAAPSTAVDLAQFRVDWIAAGELGGGIAALAAELVFSPGNLGGNNGAEEFEAFRAGADPTYLYGRFEGAWRRPLAAGWAANLRGKAQLGNAGLLPSEQLALGGFLSVRGYEERVLLADQGYTVSAELLTPAVIVNGRDSMALMGLRGVAFLDHGRGWLEGDGGRSLTGAGVGLRFEFDRHAAGRLDIGWPLGARDGGPQLHAGILVSF